MDRISIITPSLNRASLIERALDSVRQQVDPAVEHVVFDGGSTDGTLELLRSRPDITLIVDKDQNLYDAINRAVAASKGTILGFLNTDDRLAPGALAEVRRLFAADPRAQHVSGAMAIEHLDGTRPDRIYNDPRFLRLRISDQINGPTLTNSRFYRRQLFERAGGFDIRFPVMADRDFQMKALHLAPEGPVTARVLYYYGVHPGSLTMGADGPSHKYAVDLAQMAALRAGETRGTTLAPAYRRWDAWAQLYLALLDLQTSPSADALGRLLTAPLRAPIGLIQQLWFAIVDRPLKQGREAPSIKR